MRYPDIYQQSTSDPQAWWRSEAKRIDWQSPFSEVLDYARPPFTQWFVGGKTNLCHNAIDRWVASQGDKPALIAISTETTDGKPRERVYSFSELQAEVERMAAIMQALGIGKGDRVLIYMPMIAEASFAMLACARIGAIHSVVFGGFAANSLATRIDDTNLS
jgi:propionyl-CoA synthetase